MQVTPKDRPSPAVLIWAYCHATALEEHGADARYIAYKGRKRPRPKGEKVSDTGEPAPAAAAAVTAAAAAVTAATAAAAGAVVDKATPGRKKAAAGSREKVTDKAKSASAAAGGDGGDGGPAPPTGPNPAEVSSPEAAAGKEAAVAEAVADGRGEGSIGSGAHRRGMFASKEVMTWGGTIKATKFPEMIAKLRTIAVHPEDVLVKQTKMFSKQAGVLLRYRETVYERSNVHQEGVLSPLVRRALEKAGAIPVERPKPVELLLLQGSGMVGGLGAPGEGGPAVEEAAAGVADIAPAAADIKQEKEQQQLVVKKEPLEAGSAGKRSSSRQAKKQKAVEAAVKHQVKKEQVSDDDDDDNSEDHDEEQQQQQQEQRQKRGRLSRERPKGQKVYDLSKQAVVKKHEFEDFSASSSSSSSEDEEEEEGGDDGAVEAGRQLLKRRLEAAVGGVGGAGGYKGRQPEKKLRLTPRNAKKEAAALRLVKREGSGDEGSVAAPVVEERAAPSRPTEMISVEVKVYADKIGGRDVFESDLQRWYGERGLHVAQPIVGGFTWDMYTIFSAVAMRGGYQAATDRKAWRAIAREWHQELDTAKNIGSVMKQNYKKVLLDFEQYFTRGVPTRNAVFSRELAVGKSIVQRSAAGANGAGRGAVGAGGARQGLGAGAGGDGSGRRQGVAVGGSGSGGGRLGIGVAGSGGGGSGSGGLKRQGGSGDDGDGRQRLNRPRIGGEEGLGGQCSTMHMQCIGLF